MKKIIISLLFMAAPVAMFAQLKVSSDGKTLLGTNLSNYSPMLEVGFRTNGTNIGIISVAEMVSSHTGTACGIYGIGKYGSNGHTYGVVGTIDGGSQGAGIAGAQIGITNYGINGTYAGYFLGGVYCSGAMSALSYSQTSDIRLKRDVIPLRNLHQKALNKIIDMNVVEYKYKKAIPSLLLPDSVSVDEVIKASGINYDKIHIGLIAQELQKIYPELVDEGQDGYLTVNYMELVPVLICAIQELKQELDDVKDRSGEAMMSRNVTTSAVSAATANGNVLYQNTPNPFKEQTTIRFSLADDARDATICIFDMTGKMLKKLSVSSGETSIRVNGWELGEGMFLYTLMVNGCEIDTKRMIITK